MKNVTYQRGLVCLQEDEFRRVMSELIVLEREKELLEKQLQESTARVTLLEEHIRVTEAEAKRVNEPIAQRESDS